MTARLLLALSVLTTSATAQVAHEIEGFARIESVVPDWEERREITYTQTSEVDGLSFSTVDSYRTYACEGSDFREFGLEVDTDGKLMPIVLESERRGQRPKAVIPPALAKRLDVPLEGEVKALVQRTPRDIERWADGWLMAFSAGEFGGGLVYVPDEGEPKLLDAANANDLLSVGDQMLVAHGVDHKMTTPEHIAIYGHVPNMLSSYDLQSPSAVYELAEHEGNIAGRLHHGIMYVESDGTVHYPMPDNGWGPKFKRSRKRLGFTPMSIGFLPDGSVWVGGDNILAVYGNLPDLTSTQVYIPDDCLPDFGDPPAPPIIMRPGEARPRNARPGELPEQP